MPQVWMGNLQPDMTERFIMSTFNRLGFNPKFVEIKKQNFRRGSHSTYAFIHFDTNREVVDSVNKLNGKPIPNTFPVKIFKLNFTPREKNFVQDDLHIVWVGNLSSDVSDYVLFKAFTNRYSSIKNAKVIMDSHGSKGYGYVGFGVDSQVQHALRTMDRFKGIGDRPIRIEAGNYNDDEVIKYKNILKNTPQPTSNSKHCESNKKHHKPNSYGNSENKHSRSEKESLSKCDREDNALVAFNTPIDINSMNKEMKFMDMEWSLWDSMADSQYLSKELYSTFYYYC